jgi:hypothetical protein
VGIADDADFHARLPLHIAIDQLSIESVSMQGDTQI